jgi:choline-sulfatase
MRGSGRVGRSFLAAAAVGLLAAAPPPRGRTSLVLVTLDTTRSDRLGCYGAPAARTPVIDALASKGTRYARAISASPLTLPAHTSLMTGLDPPEHGMRDNGFGSLPADVPTLADALKAEGYATAAFVASRVLDRRFGLARGFDHYDDRMAAEGLGEYGYPERDAAAVTSAAAAWVAGASLRGRPFFVWVHYYDPHAPYEPPAPWRGDTPEASYAGEIAYVDRELGRLLSALPAGAAGRIVALAGDHGEALGEHGEKGHGIFLYRASLEVPLVLEGRGVPEGGVVTDVVGTRALASTLLRLIGVRDPADRFGPPLPGLPVSDKARAAPPVYSEALMPATAYGWSPLKAATDNRWRLIAAPRPELYDFVADPGELENRITDRPDVAARLKQAVEARAQGPRDRPTTAKPADPEVAASLRSLGYLSGASSHLHDAVVGGIDPKDGVPLLRELEEAQREMAAGRLAVALRTFENLVRRSPGNVPFLSHLARAQLARGQGSQAVATWRRALERNPDSDFLHAHLGETLGTLGRHAEARQEYEEALRLNPRMAKAWMGLAELAMKQDGAAEETRILDRAVAAGTESAAVFARRAQLIQAAGDLESADRDLKRATELAPDWATAWLIWGDVAERGGRATEARERYGRAAEIAPDSVEGREARRRIERLDRSR